jgi:hypothetical protein
VLLRNLYLDLSLINWPVHKIFFDLEIHFIEVFTELSLLHLLLEKANRSFIDTSHRFSLGWLYIDCFPVEKISARISLSSCVHFDK